MLRIRVTAEVGLVEGGHIVGPVESEYTTTYSRRGKRNTTLGSATVRVGMETDAERFAAVIKALTGREPGVCRRKDGRLQIQCYEGHLEGFMRYAELVDTIEEWLGETGR